MIPLLAQVSVAVAGPVRAMGPATPVPELMEDVCRYRAVLFAAERYADASFERLSTPINDIRQLGRVLETRFGFDVTLHENATESRIIDTMDALLRDVKPCEGVLVYYAGHGVLNEQTQQGFWVPVDATTSSSTWVSNADVVDRLQNLPARHVLLVVDSCFSGSLFNRTTRSARGLEVAELDHVRSLGRRTSRWVVTAGGTETVADQYRKSGMSTFAYFLTEELRHASGPWVVIDDLFPNVRLNVRTNAQQMPMQGPMLGHEGGMLVLRNLEASPVKGGATAAVSRPPAPAMKPAPQDPPVEGRWIEAGGFTMGSPPSEAGRDPDPVERQRRVKVERFWIMHHEVTVGLWREVMGSGEGEDGLPVTQVNVQDAMDFANALSRRHGYDPAYEQVGDEMRLRAGARGYRLPTEAEWERAARGQRSDEPFAGGATASAVGWVRGSGPGPHPVCKKPKNGFDLCDMTGNVAEWTGDRWVDATGRAYGHVIRGGHYRSVPAKARVAARDYLPSDERLAFMGFRLVRSGP